MMENRKVNRLGDFISLPLNFKSSAESLDAIRAPKVAGTRISAF